MPKKDSADKVSKVLRQARKIVPKYGAPEQIKFVGVNDLNPEEQDAVQRLSTEYYEKIKRELQNLTNIIVHIKVYGKSQENPLKRKKYSLHVRVIAPTKVFESDKNHDWDLPRVLHKGFEDVIDQIIHRFRTDVTRPRR